MSLSLQAFRRVRWTGSWISSGGVDRIELQGVAGMGAVSLRDVLVAGRWLAEVSVEGHVILLDRVQAGDLTAADFLFL